MNQSMKQMFTQAEAEIYEWESERLLYNCHSCYDYM